MGESLERVQNKFACIIGELCNEPVVLSKFAIWLDLRLAEYKAKGAISLDCSGESPDPKWLKGHEKPEPVVYKTDNHSYRLGNVGTHDIFNYGSNTSQPQGPPETKFGLNSNIIEDINERLSPEIVVVKEEVPDMPNSENIYPVGLHVHDQKTRKRPSTDIFPTSSPKSQRHMEDSSSISAQTGTQSLMSIIGENTDDIKDEHLSQSRGDNPMTFMPHTSIADQSYPQATISSPDESSSSQNYSSFHPQIDQTYSPNQSRQNAAVQVGEFTASSVPLPALSRQALLNSTEPGDDRDLVGVVSESAAQILQYLDLSSMWDYAEIGRRMCDTYPSIKRPGTHPWAVFVKKLSQKVRNIRWQLKKKDHKPNTKYYKRPSC